MWPTEDQAIAAPMAPREIGMLRGLTRKTSASVPDGGVLYVMVDNRADIAATNPDAARVILNIEVTDARDTAKRIEQAGTAWVAPLEDRDGGWFATATDPDGACWACLVASVRGNRH